jgi:phosphinothricin acetyltransferase
MSDPEAELRTRRMQSGAASGPARVRPATKADIGSIQRIYAHHVLNGTGSFEDHPPDEAEMAARHQAVVGRNLPYLVAVTDAGVIGFAYAGPFRLRSAYRFTVEDSVYIDAASIGLGVGRLLLGDLVARCTAQGYRQMVAMIGDSANARSIRLHRALGFFHAGTLAAIGCKFDTWLDVVFMQRPLAGPPVGAAA